MDKARLKMLARQGEGLRVEFKRKLPEIDKLLREAIALANTTGGVILIGVEDDGEIFGVKDPDEAEQYFQDGVLKYCRPVFEYNFNHISITRKRSVLAIQIEKGKKRPYALYLNKEDKKGMVYYRVEDRSIHASKELYHILKFKRNERDVKFEFGEKEKLILQYLEDHERINLEEFRQLAKISKYSASRTLVILVRANILHIHPEEQADFYSLVLEPSLNTQ